MYNNCENDPVMRGPLCHQEGGLLDNQNPLIRTKFRMPFVRPNLVERPRLRTQIAEGLKRPLTLVIAPAGFGKTTLISAAISEYQSEIAWLSLDEDDNQEGRFLSYLVAGLHIVEKAVGVTALQMLSGYQQPVQQVVLTSLVNDLDELDRNITLVLDDYHCISNPAVHTAVTFVLEHAPANFHVMIASRSDPALPIARLRARGTVIELRASDLRFTTGEVAQFLNGIMGLGLDENSLAMLETKTEGWIAGLQMAALGARDREKVSEFIEAFSGTNRFVLDFLLEEVLAGLPTQIQTFLCCTSILERFTAPLCDSLLQTYLKDAGGIVDPLDGETSDLTDSETILSYLEQANIFLVPLDQDRIWYRYHHLFADLLQARLLQTRSRLIPILHKKAAEWLEAAGYIQQAINHLIKAKALDLAALLIEKYGPNRLAENDPSILYMADLLPREVTLSRPKIACYLAYLLIIRSKIGDAIPLLHVLAETTDAGSTHKDRWISTVAATALAFLAPPDKLDRFTLPEQRFLEEIPKEDRVLQNSVEIFYGMALARRGLVDEAVKFSLWSIGREKAERGFQATPILAPFLTRIYLMQGKLQACAAMCREYLDLSEKGEIKFIFANGSMMIDYGEVLFERNHLGEAEKFIRGGLRANEPWQNIMTDGFGLSALTKVLLANGNYSEAMQAAERFESRLKEYARPREFDEDFLTLKIRVYLEWGEVQAASRWADEIQNNGDQARWTDFYRLMLARVRLTQGRYAEAERLLFGTTPPAGSSSLVRKMVEHKILMAAAAAGQLHHADAAKFLEAGLALAEPEAYVRVFLDFGEPVRVLLNTYVRTNGAAHQPFAHKILSEWPGGNNTATQRTSGIAQGEILTMREFEVLRLIADGRTNHEIAESLFVAAGTVKAHTASIYRKLDAANRTEAVAHARKMGILSEESNSQ